VTEPHAVLLTLPGVLAPPPPPPGPPPPGPPPPGCARAVSAEASRRASTDTCMAEDSSATSAWVKVTPRLKQSGRRRYAHCHSTQQLIKRVTARQPMHAVCAAALPGASAHAAQGDSARRRGSARARAPHPPCAARQQQQQSATEGSVGADGEEDPWRVQVRLDSLPETQSCLPTAIQ